MEIKVPDIGIEQVEVIEILVKVKEFVSKEQSLMVVEGEKASMEIPSPYDGVIKEIKVKVSDIVKTNSIIFIIDIVNKNDQLKKEIIHINESVQNHDKIIQNNFIHASPLIRRLSRSSNIDLKNITGTGRKNRIVKEDIEKYVLKNQLNFNSQKKILQSKYNSEKEHNFDRFGEVEKIELNKIKNVSGNALLKNWNTIPHVTQFDQVDITDLELFRKKYNCDQKEKNIQKLTILSFIIKATSKALEKFPYFNSSISSDNKNIFLKKYINIGIAVDTIHGLLVPVINNTNKKNLSEIANEILKKSESARKGKLTIPDMQGGSFTISSLGSLGGTYFSPIIHSSEAAILGISKATYQPIWNEQQFIPRLMLPLSLSYNHRIIDGAEGVRFISYINNILSDIRLLLI